MPVVQRHCSFTQGLDHQFITPNLRLSINIQYENMTGRGLPQKYYTSDDLRRASTDGKVTPCLPPGKSG